MGKLNFAWVAMALVAVGVAAQTPVTSPGGTKNTVPVFTGSAILGNSPITVSAGNVGIGTTNPGSTLDISDSGGTISLNSGGMGINREISTGAIFQNAYAYQMTHIGSSVQGSDYLNWAVWNPSGALVNSSALAINGFGNVGVGTTTPPNLLTVGNSPSGAWNPAYKVLDLAGYGYVYGSSYGTGWPGTNFGQTGWGNNQYYANGISYAVGTGASSYILQGSGQISFNVGPSVAAGSPLSFTEAMHIANNGAVGMGTTSPAYKLDVAGQIRSTSGYVFPDGTTQTTAFSPAICGGDYAESVDVAGDRKSYEPGDVLVIGAESGSDVLKSAEPYSTLVAGIYSTKPGTVGRRQTIEAKAGKTEIPMAMVGIVPTKVSAENGPIKRGDLLVTSSTLGYAMKGTDRSKMLGAVVGKALGNLDSGTGAIEVLVTLQ